MRNFSFFSFSVFCMSNDSFILHCPLQEVKVFLKSLSNILCKFFLFQFRLLDSVQTKQASIKEIKLHHFNFILEKSNVSLSTVFYTYVIVIMRKGIIVVLLLLLLMMMMTVVVVVMMMMMMMG